MHEGKDPERKRKHRKCFRVLMEIVFMALGILCSIMPYPFPLAVPIGIGTIRIISNAVKKERELEAPPTIVYCNGEKEPKKRRESNTNAVNPPQTKDKATSPSHKENKAKSKRESK